MPLSRSIRRASGSDLVKPFPRSYLSPVTVRGFGQTRAKSQIDFAALTGADLHRKSFTVDSRLGLRHVFFNVVGTSDIPSFSGTPHAISFSYYGNFLRPYDFTFSLQSALGVANTFGFSYSGDNVDKITVQANVANKAQAFNARTSGCTFSIQSAATARVHFSIGFDDLEAQEMNGQYLTVSTPRQEKILFYLTYPGSTAPTLDDSTPGWPFDYTIPVAVSEGFSEEGEIATAVFAALSVNPLLDVTKSGNTLFFSSKLPDLDGARQNMCSGEKSPDFGVGVGVSLTDSVDGREIVEITFPLSLAQNPVGKFFSWTSADTNTAHFLYFSSPENRENSRGLRVLLSSGSISGTVLTGEIAQKLNESGEFVASYRGSILTVENAFPGQRALASAGDSGATVTNISTATLPKFLPAEISKIDELLTTAGTPNSNKAVFSLWVPATSTYTRASNWLGNDLSHIPAAMNLSQAFRGCLISPIHVLVAWHAGQGVGATFDFVSAGGSVVSRTASASQRVLYAATSDIQILRLNSEVPSSIDFARILPRDLENYFPVSPLASDNFTNVARVPSYYIDTTNNARVADLAVIRNKGEDGRFTTTIARPTNTLRDSVHLDFSVGMSGIALMMKAGSRHVLLGCAHYALGGVPEKGQFTVGFDSICAPAVRDAVDAAMLSLGGGYRLESLDVDEFCSFL